MLVGESFSPFLPFAAVFLCGVAGLAETFPSFPVSGPFLPDVPGFQVPPDSIIAPQLRSSSKALPSIFTSTTARMFSVSSLLLTCPNHSSLLRLITVAIGSTFASSKISSFLWCSNRLTPIAHHTILISAYGKKGPFYTGECLIVCLHLCRIHASHPCCDCRPRWRRRSVVGEWSRHWGPVGAHQGHTTVPRLLWGQVWGRYQGFNLSCNYGFLIVNFDSFS